MSALYRREDWTLFRSTQTLAQKAGVSVAMLPRLVTKELTDNALDEAGDCLLGQLDHGVFVEDAGPGIPADRLGELFSIARPLTSSKLIRLPTRGALGNGLRVVAGAVLASAGALTVATGGRVYDIRPRDDGGADVTDCSTWDGRGTRVEVRFGPALEPGGDELGWANWALTLARGEPYRGKSSSHWYDGDAFYELLQAAGNRPLRAELEKLEGLSGKVAGDLLRPLGLVGRVANELTRDEVAAVLAAAQQRARPVAARRLGAVGADAFATMAYAIQWAEHRLPAGRSGTAPTIPAVVEAWVRVLPAEAGRLTPPARVTVCVNRTPVTAEVGAYATKNGLLVEGCGLLHYLANLGRASATVVINIITPAVALTSDGKAPDLTDLVDPISRAVDGAARRAKRSRPLAGGDGSVQPRSKKDAILELLPRGIALVSQDGQRRYTQRQLFYVVRPWVTAAVGEELTYDRFTDVIDNLEEADGPLEGMVREPRGFLYQPHTKGSIPLGTLEVAQYQRPAWTFNKVLYIEKTSLAQLLVEEGWHNRHDCAVLSSSGQATRAVKDLLDLLGGDDEPLTIFCVHDADAYGTGIYQALQEATKARPARTTTIVNLGLEAWQAMELGLEVESVPPPRDGKRRPVGVYVRDEDPAWERWLQSKRVELNALPPADFVDWLDDVMAEHDDGKVTPPSMILLDHLTDSTRNAVTERVHGRILAEAFATVQVAVAMGRAGGNLGLVAGDLTGELDDLLDGQADGWRDVVDQEAAELVEAMAQAGALENLLADADMVGDDEED